MSSSAANCQHSDGRFEEERVDGQGTDAPYLKLDVLAHVRSTPLMVGKAVPRRPTHEENKVGGQGLSRRRPGVGGDCPT